MVSSSDREIGETQHRKILCITGGKAIAIPGEIKGFHHAWMKFGRLPWRMLVEPSIEICKVGMVINRDAALWAKVYEEKIRNDEDVR